MTMQGAGQRTGPGDSGFQVATLVALRMLIGWHFLYEGIAKLTSPYWTAAGYLAEAKGFLKGPAIALAASPTAVTVVDYLNEYGLVLIGLGLLVGVLTRFSMIMGVVLLALYYVVAPPFPGYVYAMPSEGSYIIVNKVLIEAAALLVLLAFPASRAGTLDALLRGMREEPAVPQPTDAQPTEA